MIDPPMSAGEGDPSASDTAKSVTAGLFVIDENLIRDLSCLLTGDIVHKVNTDISIYRGLVAQGNQLIQRQPQRSAASHQHELQLLNNRIGECEARLRSHLAGARAARYA